MLLGMTGKIPTISLISKRTSDVSVEKGNTVNLISSSNKITYHAQNVKN